MNIDIIESQLLEIDNINELLRLRVNWEKVSVVNVIFVHMGESYRQFYNSAMML